MRIETKKMKIDVDPFLDTITIDGKTITADQIREADHKTDCEFNVEYDETWGRINIVDSYISETYVIDGIEISLIEDNSCDWDITINGKSMIFYCDHVDDDCAIKRFFENNGSFPDFWVSSRELAEKWISTQRDDRWYISHDFNDTPMLRYRIGKEEDYDIDPRLRLAPYNFY